MKKIYNLLILFVACLLTVSVQAETILFEEDFEAGSSLPTGWTTDGSGTWQVGQGDYSTSTGAGHGSKNAFIKHGTTGAVTKLITPAIDLSSASSAELSFMHIQRSWSGDYDELRVYYRASSEDAWALLQEYTSAVASWTTEEAIALPSLSATYQIAFEYTDNYGYGVGIDYVKIVQGASCAKPTGVALDEDPTTESAYIVWDAVSGAESYDLEYSTSSDFTNPQAPSEMEEEVAGLYGLTPATTYYVRVRAFCGGEDYSEWSSTFSFKTKCVAVSAFPWSENFDDVTASSGVLPDCWNRINEGSSNSYPYVYSYGARTGNCLYFYAYTSSSYADQYAVLPEMSNLDGKRIVFWAKGSYSGNKIQVGRMSNPADAGTFVQIGEDIELTTSYQKYAVNMEESGDYIAFKLAKLSSTNAAYIDDIVVEEIPACLEPSGLAFVSSETNSAILNWEAGESGESAWDIYYSTENVAPTAETVPSIVGTSDKEIPSGLNPSTTYYVWVRAHCNEDDRSAWIGGISFQTECEAVSALSENFDSYDIASAYTPSARVLPVCWSAINTSTYSDYKLYPTMYYYSYTDYSHSQNNSLKFYSYYSSWGSYDPQPQYAIMPVMNFDTNKRIVFWALGANSSSTIKIGRMTDPADASTFNQIGEEIALTTSYQKFTINLTGEGNYIAIMIDAATSSRTSNGAYIDDIVVEDVPSCLEPSGLAFASATTTSATFTWTAGDSETAWDIYYSTENVAPTAETAPIIEETSDKEIPSGLNPSSTYYVWVRAHCSNSDQSPWTGGISFNTACDAVASFPWRENFDTRATGDIAIVCWENKHISGSGSYVFQVADGSAASTDTKIGKLPDMNSGTLTLLTLPEMTIPTANAYQFALDVYRNHSSYSDEPEEGIRVYASLSDTTDESAVQLAFIPREYAVASGTDVKAESEAGWYTYEFTIPMSGNVHILLRGESKYATSTYFDNLEVGLIPTCQKPADPKCDAKTAHTATLSWTNGAEGQNAWQIVVDTIAAFNPDTVNAARIIDVASNPAIIDGLLANKTYYAYVRANCGEDGFSAWSKKKVTFTTIAGNIAPSGLAVDGASLASDAATVTWVSAKNDLHASFDLFYSKINELPETPEGDSLFTNIADTFKVLSGLDAETTYYVWVRDNCGADGNSAWVSFSFTTLANCPVPGELSASEVAAHSAKIAWNVGANDSYNVRYRTAALDNVLLEQGFEDGIGGWTTSNAHSSTGISSSSARTGAKGFSFYYTSNPPQYLISPEIAGIDADASLEFYYKNYSSSWAESFEVGFSSTDNATSSFAFGAEVTADDQQWHQYSVTVPAGTKYISIKCTSDNAFYLYIDDIVLLGAPTPAGDWTVEPGTAEKFLTIDGLEPDTKYEAQVQGVCGTNPTEWSESVFFTTIPSCMAPVVAEPVILPDGATFSWTAGGSENRFEYACVAKDAEVEAWTLLDENVFSKTINEKASGVNYDFYVRAYCGEEDRSASVKKSFAAFCKAPTAPQVADITTTTATLSWIAAADEAITKYQYVVLPAGSAADWTKAVLVENATSVALDELTASSSYVVYIRSYYNEFSQSAAISTIFATECDAVSAASGWKEDFNGYTGSTSSYAPSNYPNDQLPTCWQFLNRAASSSNYPQVFLSSYSSYAVSGNCLFFKSSSTTPLYAILPEFAENISALQLTFTYRNEGTSDSNGTLYVGYLADPADASTFASVLTCERTTTLTEKEVLFTDAPAGSRIAFKYEGGTNDNYYLSIDDVFVGLVPTCLKPAAPKCDAKTAHTATLSWTNGEEGQNAWQIVVDTIAAFNPDTVNAARIIDVASNPAIIDGLLANKTYYAYVRAKCGEESVSYWSANKATFTTIAGNIAPSGLAVDNASLASDAAIVTWVAAENDLHENFELFYSKINELPEAPEGDSLISNIAEAEYAFAGLEAETTYYVWVRDNCGADGYSAWTSSISFTTLANCPVPGELSASEVAAHSAKIAWNVGANDSYNVRYRTAALDNVLLEQGFEDGMGSWTTSNLASGTGISSSAAHSGTYGYSFRWGTPPQYLISPEIIGIDADASLEFYYKNYSSSYAESFEVGFSSTDNATSSFAFEAEVTADDLQWHKYSVTVPAGTKYISIKCTSDNAFYLYIDDIVLLGAATPAGEWQDGGNSLVKELTISGLEPETKYEAQAQGVCGVDVTEWSESVFFTTTPSCIKPASLDAEVLSANSVKLDWTAGGEETFFQVVCVLSGEEPNWEGVEPIEALTITIDTLNIDNDYDFYVRAYCGESDHSDFRMVSAHVGYCVPAPTSIDGSGIIAIAFNEEDAYTEIHPTAAPFYADNKAIEFVAHADEIDSILITYSTGYTYGTVIWVDWNKNLAFEASEVVFSGESSESKPTTLSCVFTIPAETELGAYRLRIGGADSYFDGYVKGTSSADPDPCGTGTYTIYEDYTLLIVEKPHDPTGLSGAGIENVAIKRIENDQVVIIRNGEKFTIMGVKIQ